MIYFKQNQNPSQVITNLGPYTFTIGEGTSVDHIIPSGIYCKIGIFIFKH